MDPSCPVSSESPLQSSVLKKQMQWYGGWGASQAWRSREAQDNHNNCSIQDFLRQGKEEGSILTLRRGAGEPGSSRDLSGVWNPLS